MSSRDVKGRLLWLTGAPWFQCDGGLWDGKKTAETLTRQRQSELDGQTERRVVVVNRAA